MVEENCPFCGPIVLERVFYIDDLVYALWDGFPVSAGHALLVTRRHVANWFEASQAERLALLSAIDIARNKILESQDPQGFNIGINVGAAAGQTIFHLHVHIIPRYQGDVRDPRGGVRHVIPERANYIVDSEQHPILASAVPHTRALVQGDQDPLLPHLLAHMDRSNKVDMAIAFVLLSGVSYIEEHLRDLLQRGGSLRLLVGDYMNVTEPNALVRLLDLEGDVEIRVFNCNGKTFHPKAYLFFDKSGNGIAYVGSSNLTAQALTDGIEWNCRIISSRNRQEFSDVVNAFNNLFYHPSTQPLSFEWIEAYRERRGQEPSWNIDLKPEALPSIPEPHEIQQEALEKLEATRRAGNSAGLVVLATGLGKTWLSAFDSNRSAYKRVLFVAHREEILTQAMKTFRTIRPTARLGHYTGKEKTKDAEILFASVQTLGQRRHLESFAPQAFDYIIIDEFHHAAASTYRRLIDYFQPKFLLGLTATPERTDGGDLLALCQENLVYRCDLIDGIRRGLLSPFHYYGVPDEVDYRNIPWRSTRFDEEALTQAVATRSRAQNALDQYQQRSATRTLAFCCSQRHANFMADFFREAGINAVAVHSGEDSAPRARSLEELETGNIQVIFTVDIFNEGLDIPAIDTVMMLRPD